MKTILFTGANGFVGNHLAKELSDAGYRVVGVGGPRTVGAKDPNRLDGYMIVDLTKPSEVASIPFSDVSGIVHLASLAVVSASFEDPLNYIATNTALTINLFETAIKQNAKPKFVLASSGTIYTADTLPITESSATLPTSPYSVSKITQEQLGLYYTMRGFEVVIARPFNHIGPGQNLGFIIPDLTKQVIDAKRGLVDKILVGNLDAKRDYTDVRDVVRAYRLLFEAGKSGEMYNICSGTSRSGWEMLDLIRIKAQSEAPVEEDPARMRPSDVPDVYGSHDKLTADTGWQPEIPLETTIADVVADWRSRE